MRKRPKFSRGIVILGILGIVMIATIAYFKIENKTDKPYTVMPYLPDYFSHLVDWTFSPNDSLIMMGYAGVNNESAYIVISDGDENISNLFPLYNEESLNNEIRQEIEAFTVDEDGYIYVMKRNYQWVQGEKKFEPLAWIDQYSSDGEWLGEIKSFTYEGNAVQSIDMKEGTWYIHEKTNETAQMAGTVYIINEQGTNVLGDSCWGNIEAIDKENMYYVSNGYLCHYNNETKEKNMLSALEGGAYVGMSYNKDNQMIEIQEKGSLWQYDKQGRKVKEIIRTDQFPYMEEEVSGKFYKTRDRDYFVSDNMNSQRIYKISKTQQQNKWETKNTYQREETRLDEFLGTTQWFKGRKNSNEVIILGQGNEGAYTYQVNTDKMQWEKMIHSQKGFITRDVDGYLYELLLISAQDRQLEYEIKVYNDDGDLEKTLSSWQLQLDENDMGEYQKIEYINGYLILHTNTDMIEVRNLNGDLKSTYFNVKMVWILEDEMVYVLSSGRLYKQILGEELDDKQSVFLKGVDYQIGIVDEERDELYLCTVQGIIDRYDGAGEYKERILDISRVFSQENKFISNKEGMMLDGNVIYLSCNSMEDLKTYANQIKISDLQEEDKKTLSCLTMDNTPMLNEVIRLYKLQNPNISLELDKINIHWISEAEREQLIQRTNTEILAGKVADILPLSSLPYNHYIKKGALLPIGNVEELSQKYHFGVVNSYSKDGKVYAIPLGMQIPVMITNETLLDDMGIRKKWRDYHFDQIMEIASQMPKDKEIYLLPKGSTHYMAHYMLTVYYDQYMYQQLDGNWEENLKVLLQDLKEILALEHPVYTEEDMLLNKHGEMDQVILIPTLCMNYKALEDGKSYQTMPILGDKYYPINTMDIIGVSSVVDNQELAFEFVDYALSKEIQIQLGKEGFPIHQGARKQLKTDATKEIEQGESFKDIEGIDDVIEQLTGLFHEDSYVKCVRKEGMKFLNGEYDVEETINHIRQQISIMKEE